MSASTPHTGRPSSTPIALMLLALSAAGASGCYYLFFAPDVEICDGDDNDGDGLTDEDLTTPLCGAQAAGVCTEATAARTCLAAQGWTPCQYPAPFEDSSETLCDGADNDCDGLTDEGLLPGCDAWAFGAGGTGADAGTAVATLADGGFVVAGSAEGTAAFGEEFDGAFAITSAGATDAFVARFGPDGRTRWVVRAGGAGADSATALAAMPDGGVAVLGTFQGEAVFGAGEPGETRRQAVGEVGLFVMRLTPAGTLAWVSTAGGTGWMAPATVAALGDGSTLIAGGFTGQATFGAGEPAQAQLASAGDTDAFFARLGPDGRLLWAHRAGGPAADMATGVALTPDGGFAATGRFEAIATFGVTETDSQSVFAFDQGGGPTGDVFVARFDSAGTLRFVRNAGGAARDTATGLAVLPDGAIVVVGTASGPSVVFGPGDAGTRTFTFEGERGFVARFGADGSLASAALLHGSEPGTGPAAVGVTGSGLTLVVGNVGGTAASTRGAPRPAPDGDKGGGPVDDGGTDGETDGGTDDGGTDGGTDPPEPTVHAFVSAVTADGVVAWNRMALGRPTAGAQALAVRPDGSLFVVGSFQREVVRQDSGITFASAGGTDVLIWHLGPP